MLDDRQAFCSAKLNYVCQYMFHCFKNIQFVTPLLFGLMTAKDEYGMKGI